ncbi:MAG: dephospho-CoA kinase [Pseudomonadota bacterium]
MKKLGLTGSIGMGKSTVAAMFADAGVPVFDADAEVHQLQGPGGELVAAIEELCPGTTGPEGVNRERLSAVVLGDRDKLHRLEAIIHPAVARNREIFFEANKEAPLVLFDIPLLLEKRGGEQFDAVIVVSAPADVQRERVLARPGMTVQKFEHILGLQMPDAEKRALADFVIDTGKPLDETRAQVDALVTCLSEHDVRYCQQCVR